MIFWCRDDLALGLEVGLEYYYFRVAFALGMFQAVFTCLFLNTEYGDGTIRNKLIIGHTRQEVYLANFLTVFAASMLMLLAWAVGGCVGIPLVGTWRFGAAGLASYLLLMVAFSAVFSAVFTFIGMIYSRRSATVVTVLTFFALLMAASMVDNILSEPEFASGIIMTIDGIQTTDPEPNPHYVTGAMRAFYEFVRDLLPTGQAVQVLQVQIVSAAHSVRMLVCDVVLTAIFTLGGLAIFERKDLK